MIYYLPIEPLESRYTAQMLRWVVRELDESGLAYQLVMPDVEDHSITRGQFLDVYGTIGWKAKQIDKVSQLFASGQVKDGDAFLIGDLWFPGLEAIPYMSILSGIQTSIWGWHYAGCADPTDFVQPCCSVGLRDIEKGWLKFTSGIFVGSHDLRDKMYDTFGDVGSIYVIGLVWDYEDVLSMVPTIPPDERPKRIIFPHRCAPEKNPEAFYDLANHFAGTGWDFVITSSRNGSPKDLGFKTGPNWRVLTGLSKRDYYEVMASSRVFFSAAYQETFGYALQEAIVFGVTPVCPDRVSYPEVLHKNTDYLYISEGDSWALVAEYVESPKPAPLAYTVQYHRSARAAISLMQRVYHE